VSQESFDGIRKLTILAVIGFVVVIFAGPLVAIASVVFSIALALLVFAFLGLLVVGGLQILLGRQLIDWQNFHAVKNATGKTCHHFRQALVWLWTLPLAIAEITGEAARRATGFLWNAARATVKMAVEITLMTLTGGVVGWGWERIAGPIQHDPGLPIPLYAILGAMIGCLVGTGMVIHGIRSRGRLGSAIASH